MASAPPATTPQTFVEPRAAWRVTLDGQDLTATLAPLLVSLSLTEKRGEAADQLEIELHDADGTLALPPAGARLTVALGWDRGTGVTTGLVPKASFVVDDVEWSGPPDKITIRAHSADLKDSFRTRKNRMWTAQTLGAIIGKIASDNGVAARCHPDLAGQVVDATEQANKSDMELLRDLGRRYDAIATVKNGTLLFTPIDAATTPTGKAIPALAITRQAGDRYAFARSARENGQDGAEAQWHDGHAARRRTVHAGGSKPRRLKRIHASASAAQAAADAESKRLHRATATLQIDLAYGDGQIAVGRKVTVQGFKSEIDAFTWLIAGVTHKIEAGSGFRTSLEMEVAG